MVLLSKNWFSEDLTSENIGFAKQKLVFQRSQVSRWEASETKKTKKTKKNNISEVSLEDDSLAPESEMFVFFGFLGFFGFGGLPASSARTSPELPGP